MHGFGKPAEIEIPACKHHSCHMDQITETPAQQAGLVFTDAAARKALELILEERNPGLKLRVYISGGG